ncbi:cellulose binding domain-containing protein [Spirillospora sp. NPDC048823]|uniref:cellulose binding domain-containing protein n=1 Tax=unclassified Spirillospora TaxID=2642701 RepID=UPI0037219C69
MGRHSRVEQPDDDPVPGTGASRGPFYGAPPGRPYDAFSGPTDDQVYVSPHDRISTGPPPDAERENGPPPRRLFEPLPGDYPGDFPGAPGPYPAAAERPPARLPDLPDLRPRPAASGGRRWLKSLSVLPVPLMPILALVIAVGIVSYALSTQQISLNFAGGAPQNTQTDQRDSQVSQRGPGERASRGAGRSDGLVIAFRVASKAPGGFKATATIANKGPRPVGKWALAFKIPTASVTAVSGATVVRTGEVPFVRGRAGIAPGETVRIVFAARGTAATPTSCVLNGKPCAIV